MKPIVLSEEVRTALAEGRGVVALETSVVAQGLPSPHNLTAAIACEEAVRAAGSVPATTALLDGVPHVGLAREQLDRLASGEKGLLKLAARDLAPACAAGASGGTTVSATCELARLAGIRIFATGGIGGVHRGVVDHFDVSQDLPAIARNPVAVVCAGAKSVLDLPKTMEALETLGVPVVGVGTSELPSFFSRTSGLPLEHRVESPEQAAAIVRARVDGLGQGGVVFTLPPPADSALDPALVETHLAEALEAAERASIRGKAVTPFLLRELVQRTNRATLQTNVALLENNARFAGALASALSGR